jgi:hypothetical protein
MEKIKVEMLSSRNGFCEAYNNLDKDYDERMVKADSVSDCHKVNDWYDKELLELCKEYVEYMTKK